MTIVDGICVGIDEPALEPNRVIIDSHLHLWDILPAPGLPQEPQRFLFPELLATVRASGHTITHSVFVECGQMYRCDGPHDLRSLGETEFANGIAAMSATGSYGRSRFAHRIVGSVDLRLGDRLRPLLEAHIAIAGKRFRGIRMYTAFSESGLFGQSCDPSLRHILRDPKLHTGARVLADMGLSLDVWCLQSQLDDVKVLADAIPGLVIILDHLGTPDTRTERVAHRVARFADWKAKIDALAQRSNVRIKLGGLGMEISKPIAAQTGTGSSHVLAKKWRLAIETVIEKFGPSRAMFESNFPPDKAAGTYGATWNAFKLIAQQYNESEKDSLFRRTAAETYDIAV